MARFSTWLRISAVFGCLFLQACGDRDRYDDAAADTSVLQDPAAGFDTSTLSRDTSVTDQGAASLHNPDSVVDSAR
jgi:hypothetical protein